MQRILLVASLLTLGCGFYWPTFFSKLKSRHSQALILSSKGTSEHITRGQKKSLLPRSASQPLALNESLSTGMDGEILLQFKSGARVRILPNSLITLLRKTNTPMIAVRRGELEVVDEGLSRSVLVSQDGKESSLSDYRFKDNSQELWIDPRSLDTVKMAPTERAYSSPFNSNSVEGNANLAPSEGERITFTNTPLEPLTEEKIKGFESQIRAMITDQISKQKTPMYRCYSRLLQKRPNTEGALELNFKVNGYGKVVNSMIIKNDMKEKDFERCIVEIVKRAKFKPFQGEPVSAFLPLRFQKNIVME